MSEVASRKKILHPQGPFLQKWNKIFVLSCLIAVSLDPLFFYVPVIEDGKKCLSLDSTMEITASVFRSFSDIFYMLHIIFQFHTGFIAPSSREFGRGVLVEDTRAIAKRYLSSYFLIDILSVLPLPQVIGAFWYLFSIERQTNCWRQACGTQDTCRREYLFCDGDGGAGNLSFLDNHCPIRTPNETVFNFGIFLDALQSGVVLSSTGFPEKFFYCFWWGMRNLSSLGQDLKTSTYVWEKCFAVLVSISGWVLLPFVIVNIVNIKTNFQSPTARSEEMRIKRRDTEQWMSRRLLPDNIRERIRRYEQFRWQETRGVDEEMLVQNLPRDLRRDIKRHLCVPLLKRGKLSTTTTNGGRTGVFISEYLEAGDFCGEELLTWALDRHSSSNLPISTRTVRTITKVEAFALMADDLKFVASQFRQLHGKQLRHTLRFHSQQWRTWAACSIQAAWRRYRKKKREESLWQVWQEENRLKMH